MALITIIIPLYNKEYSIKKTVISVLKQDFRDFELLIVNDGSTDKSCDEIASIHDERIRMLTKPNGGVSDARNFGIENSQSEYVFFLDADDIIYPNCLAILFHGSLIYTRAQIIIGNYYFVESNGSKYSSSDLQNHDGYILNPLKSFYEETISFRVGVMLFRREVFDNERFNVILSVHEDTDMWVRLLRKFKVAYCPEIIHEYLKCYSGLSEKRISINKEFAFYINLNKTNSKYERLILANNLLRSIIRRVFLKDYNAVKFLVVKNVKQIPFLLYIYTSKKYKVLFKYK